MSKDPAFLFYPADAANDTQFMNRLEKGAYFDLVKSQRMYKGFTVVLLRKIFGTDFEAVWPALEHVLEKDKKGEYYVPWLRQSLIQRKKFTKKQKERIDKRWKKNGNTNTLVLPYIVNENENKIEDEIKNGNKNEKVKYAENVELKESEYQKLCADYGTHKAKQAIEYLDMYKQEKNYPTKSDYHAIKRWVIEAISKPLKSKNIRPPIDYIIAPDGSKIHEKDIDFSKLGK